jgi:hypothetical protein
MSYLGNNNLPWDISRSSPIPTDAERFSGNSSTTTFTLTRSVNFPTDLEVFVENIQQEPITAYTVNGNSVVFTEAPPTGTNNVYVVYRNYQSGAQVSLPDGSITYSKLANNIRVFTTDNFTANGNVSSYGLSEPPADANTVFVTVDGVVQRAPAHYTTSGSTITFTSAPPFSANVHIRHLGFRTTSTITVLAANSNISQPILSQATLQGTTTANGNVILSPGSVSAPALSFSANTTTGIFFPAADTIAFATAGTEDMRITNTGKVAIGTASPNASAITTIKASAAGDYQIQLEQDNGTDGYALRCSASDGDLTFNRHASSTFTERMRLTIGGNLQFNSGYGSVVTAYGCRAWVAFNGTGTPAIRASGNISSLGDFGTGDFSINFITNMPDTNYSIVGSSVKSGGGPSGTNSGVVTMGESPAVGGTGVGVITVDGTAIDRAYVYVAVFR